jgi:signal transduction histidine kinase
MHNKTNGIFFGEQQEIRRFGIGFTIAVVFVVFSALVIYFYYSAATTFQDENEKIKQSYTELQKNLLKTRVDQAYSFVESIRLSSENRLKDTLKERVVEAYNAASFIYEKYKGKESEASIKGRIKDALEKMRYENGKSYVWITDYNNIAVTYSTNKSLEGKYIGDEKDNAGNYTIKKQSETARSQKEGFLRDYYSKKGESSSKKFEQITFVKDFGRFGWYFGSAVFLDDFNRKVQDEALSALAGLRFDNNYIFVDTVDGYALLMNGQKLEKPEFVMELSDKNGVKIIKEQLKAAKLTQSGGYVEYVWHEPSLGKDMPHLSFCRMIDDWGWKIGSGLYMGRINDEIERRKEAFRQKIIKDTLIILSLVVILLFIGFIAAQIVDKKILAIFERINEKVAALAADKESKEHNDGVL